MALTLVVVPVKDTGTEHGSVTVPSVVHGLCIGQVVNVVQLRTLGGVIAERDRNSRVITVKCLISTHPATNTFTK